MKFTVTCLGITLGVLGCGLVRAQQDRAPQAAQGRSQPGQRPASKKSGDKSADKTAAAEKPASFLLRLGGTVEPQPWIGVQCEPLGAALRDQLQLEDGLLVQMVVPDSPASQAGLKVHDVLVRAGKMPLADVAALVGAVRQAGQQPLKLTVVRRGKKQLIQVTPQVRKDDQLFKLQDLLEEKEHAAGPEWDALQEALRHLPQPPGKELNMFFVKPGMVLPDSALGRMRDLPKGVSLTIHKRDGQPAEITVQRGDDRWQVKEGQFDKLPADLRGPVARLLASPLAMPADPRRLGKGLRYRLEPGPAASPGTPQRKPDISHRLQQELSREVEQLQGELEKVRSSLRRGATVERLKKQVELLEKEVESLRKAKRSPDQSR